MLPGSLDKIISDPSMIELRNISKKFKRGTVLFTALDDVSVKIKEGDYMAVVGPSGAGKSTLLYIIGGLIHPDSGDVIFNGKDLYKQRAIKLNVYRQRHLGFMFQQFHLMPYLTVMENIKLACYEKSQTTMIDYYLEKCSIAGLKNKYPSELSVGEKQRVAFIRAIISDPALLLADEPTGNLDPDNSLILMSLIKDYHKNNRTVILVTHRPELSDQASAKIKLDKGRIISIT